MINTPEKIERFKRLAQEAGVRVTLQRIEIFKEVLQRKDHPDAHEIWEAIHKRMPPVSRDTVYRTLSLLVELGLLKTLDTKHQSLRYDADLTPHHHFICRSCGLIQNFYFDVPCADTLIESIKDLGQVHQTHIEAFGTCRQCAETDASASQKPNPPKP